MLWKRSSSTPVLYKKESEEMKTSNKMLKPKLQWKSESNIARNSSIKHKRASSFAFHNGKAFQRILFRRESRAKDSPAVKTMEEVHNDGLPNLDITWSPTMDSSSSEDEFTQVDSADTTSVDVHHDIVPSPPPMDDAAAAVATILAPINIKAVTATSSPDDSKTKSISKTVKRQWIGLKTILAGAIFIVAAMIVLALDDDLVPSVTVHSKNILCAPIRPGTTVTNDSLVDSISFYAPWWVPTSTSSSSAFFSKSTVYNIICSDRINTSLHIMPSKRDASHMTVNMEVQNDEVVTCHQDDKVTNVKVNWDGQAMYLEYGHGKRGSRIMDAPWTNKNQNNFRN